MSHSPFFFKCFLLCILKSTFFPRRVPYVNWSYLWGFFLHPEQVLWQFWLKCLSPLQQNFSTSLFEHCWLMLSIAWISFFLFHKVQLSSPTDPLIILLLSLWLRIQHQCSTGGLSGAQKLTDVLYTQTNYKETDHGLVTFIIKTFMVYKHWSWSFW